MRFSPHALLATTLLKYDYFGVPKDKRTERSDKGTRDLVIQNGWGKMRIGWIGQVRSKGNYRRYRAVCHFPTNEPSTVHGSVGEARRFIENAYRQYIRDAYAEVAAGDEVSG